MAPKTVPRVAVKQPWQSFATSYRGVVWDLRNHLSYWQHLPADFGHKRLFGALRVELPVTVHRRSLSGFRVAPASHGSGDRSSPDHRHKVSEAPPPRPLWREAGGGRGANCLRPASCAGGDLPHGARPASPGRRCGDTRRRQAPKTGRHDARHRLSTDALSGDPHRRESPHRKADRFDPANSDLDTRQDRGARPADIAGTVRRRAKLTQAGPERCPSPGGARRSDILRCPASRSDRTRTAPSGFPRDGQYVTPLRSRSPGNRAEICTDRRSAITRTDRQTVSGPLA